MELPKDAGMSYGWLRLIWPPNWKRMTSGADNDQPVCELRVRQPHDLLRELLPIYYGQPLKDLAELDNHGIPQPVLRRSSSFSRRLLSRVTRKGRQASRPSHRAADEI
jgi:hypothetical protein